MKMPTTIGATIDLLFTLREQRRELEAKIKTIKEQEDAVDAHLMNNFEKAGLDGARGKLAQVSIKRSTVADVQDWDKLYAYISRNKAWDLLQKRASITALRARWDDKKVVPGVEPKEITALSLTKVQ